MAQRRKHRDPYALAQGRQRKAANLARREVLEKERREALGDPIHGIPTPFLESFDDVAGSAALDKMPVVEGVQIKAAKDVLLNHYLKPSELEQSIEHSYSLTEPEIASSRDRIDPEKEAREKKTHEEGHARAAAALVRIVSLANASQKDKTRANVQRCVETFGRHNTDSVLKPRASANPELLDEGLPTKTPRGGPDTGSSEVQIAILTAKIRVLAKQLALKGGSKDKVNKRNLRLLVHRRQKLLKYLRTKERGSDRWKNLIETLGLTEGTWTGEISL
jgi:ribosomal protein S15